LWSPGKMLVLVCETVRQERKKKMADEEKEEENL
jgi:hypothetical protein